jgi:XTP/dITP diphosphohydrolase
MSPLVIATHNEGKAREIGELLAGIGIQVISAASLGLPEPEETGQTFAENAAIKSESAAKLSGHWALADDSGLCVTALDGAPGIYSARWAGPAKDFAVAFERIRNGLLARGSTPEGAAAYFICLLSLTSPEGITRSFEGRVDGTLTFPPRGTKGFGYDPIFIPAGHRSTFAEMEPAEKQAISHRARAFAAFTAYVSRREAS